MYINIETLRVASTCSLQFLSSHVFLNPHQFNFNDHVPLNIPENCLSRSPMTPTLRNSMVNSHSRMWHISVEHSFLLFVLWTPPPTTFLSISSAVPSQSPLLDLPDLPDLLMWGIPGQAQDLCSQMVSQLPLLPLLRHVHQCGHNDLVITYVTSSSALLKTLQGLPIPRRPPITTPSLLPYGFLPPLKLHLPPCHFSNRPTYLTSGAFYISCLLWLEGPSSRYSHDSLLSSFRSLL